MTAFIAILVALVGFWLFFFVVKRVLRMAIRLAIIGALLFALLAGGIAWWWYAPGGDSGPESRNTSTRSPARNSR